MTANAVDSFAFFANCVSATPNGFAFAANIPCVCAAACFSLVAPHSTLAVTPPNPPLPTPVEEPNTEAVEEEEKEEEPNAAGAEEKVEREETEGDKEEAPKANTGAANAETAVGVDFSLLGVVA